MRICSSLARLDRCRFTSILPHTWISMRTSRSLLARRSGCHCASYRCLLSSRCRLSCISTSHLSSPLCSCSLRLVLRLRCILRMFFLFLGMLLLLLSPLGYSVLRCLRSYVLFCAHLLVLVCLCSVPLHLAVSWVASFIRIHFELLAVLCSFYLMRR